MDGFIGGVSTEAHATAMLGRDGFCILRDIIDPALVAQIRSDLAERFERTPFSVGNFYGTRTKRFGGLLKRSAAAEAFAMHPTIMAIVQNVLGPFCDRLQLNLTQALEIHPGETRQAPHRDQDMWQGPTGEVEYLINVMWPFTEYTAENGATVLYPGTHRIVPGTTHEVGAVSAEMSPGSALLFLGSTLHGAGPNRSPAARTGMIISYCLGWLKPYENQWLVYPPEVARSFSPELAALVGYQLHRPNLGNYEGQCPSVLLRDDPPNEYLPATDEVRPEQAERLASFKALQIALSAS